MALDDFTVKLQSSKLQIARCASQVYNKGKVRCPNEQLHLHSAVVIVRNSTQ